MSPPYRVGLLALLLSELFFAHNLYAQTPDLTSALTKKSPSSADVVADKIYGQPDREVTLEGNAEIKRDNLFAAGDKIIYRQVEDEVEAIGNARMRRDNNEFTGNALRVQIDANTGYVLQPSYVFHPFVRPGQPIGMTAHGQAERIDLKGPSQSTISNGNYTTCEPGRDDWKISADKIDIDRESNTGRAQGGTLYLGAVPVLTAPTLSFPLNGERKTGVLSPTLGSSSKGGTEMTVPYYWNLAPNRDLTIYPRVMARRGLQIGADARYLGDTYRGQLFAEMLPNDRITNQNRWAYSWTHNNNFSNYVPGWSAAWNVNGASDNDYPSDFGRSITASAQRLLPRTGSLNYSAGWWTFAAQVQRYQTLQDSSNSLTPPYEKVPQFTARAARYNVGGFDWSIEADATRFSHPTLTRGERTYIAPQISYPVQGAAYFITPKLSLNAAAWRVDNPAAGAQSSFSRVLPTFSTDSGLFFEREARWFGRSIKQTLEPRLFYVYTPYRNQSLLPNFDSAVNDFNFAQIFSENIFSGTDRISDANQLTAALVSRFIDTNSGAELMRFALAQRRYFNDQRVLADSGAVTAKSSDILLAASGRIFNNVSIDTGLQVGANNSQISRTNFGIRYHPDVRKTINFEYRYLRGSLEQYDISTQWALTSGLYAVARANYSVADKKIIEGLAGFEYDAGCWIVRAVAQRFITATQTPTTSFFIQLELNGFSKIGSNPLEALKRNIPGYQRINDNREFALPLH